MSQAFGRSKAAMAMMACLLVTGNAWLSEPIHRYRYNLLESTPSRRSVSTSPTRLSAHNYGSEGKPVRVRGDGRIVEMNMERIKSAGKVGSKRFVDPCKVFVGNLPFDVDDDALQDFILETLGQSRLALMSCKIIREWKTGKSKGYGFVVFTEPIYATVCIDTCNGVLFNGRAISVSQGKKKSADNTLYVKKKREPQLDAEDIVISTALGDAEDSVKMKFESKHVGKQVGNQQDQVDAVDSDDFDAFLQRQKSYEGDVDPNLNREQRRLAQRKLKKKRVSTKGFGAGS